MSFLKKLGTILAQVGATALGIGPIVGPLFGAKGDKVTGTIATISNDFTQIAQVVVQIEAALQGKTGADKLAAAVNLVGPIIMTSEAVSGKKIADPAKLKQGIAEVTQGVVDILNSLDQDSTKTEVSHT